MITNISPDTVGVIAEQGTTVIQGIATGGIEWLKSNWYYTTGLLLIIFGVVAKYTKTPKDDKIIAKLKALFSKITFK